MARFALIAPTTTLLGAVVAFCISVIPPPLGAQQTTVVGGKQQLAGATTAYASSNTPSATAAPTTPADGDEWYDNTQNAEAFQQSTNTTVYRGGSIIGCVNVSPVSASANTTSPQDLCRAQSRRSNPGNFFEYEL